MNTPAERARIIAAHENDLRIRQEAIATSQRRADSLKDVIAKLKAADADLTASEEAAKATKPDA